MGGRKAGSGRGEAIAILNRLGNKDFVNKVTLSRGQKEAEE